MEASIYRLRPRDLLVLCLVSLLLLGVLMVQSASTRVTDAAGWDWTAHALKQMTLVGIAIAVFFVVGFSDYRRLIPGRGEDHPDRLRPSSVVVWLWAATVVLSAATLVPGIGKTVNGARRWIGAGPLQLQPSELAKWSVVLLLAWALAYKQSIRDKFGNFVWLWVFVAVPCLLVVIQDFGTAALIGTCAIVLMIVARVKWWHLGVLIPPIMGIGFWFVRHKEYRWRRITSFLDPFADPRGEGYHMVQSLLSFASGGMFGRGLGNGVQKLGYLPEDTTDFIFAVICEELGVFGALLTMLLYLGIAFVGWQVIKDKKDPFARLLVFGITAMICLQAMINMAVATVSVPPKGMSLPLVSAGGSGMVITAAALGLIYSVARSAERETAGETEHSAGEVLHPRLEIAGA